MMVKNILITGCSTGIGYYCAKKLNDQRDFNVIATARQQKDVDRLNGEGIKTFLLDLNSSESINEGFEKVLRECNGRIFALFNNGAFGQPGAVEDLSREVLKEQFETNFFGTHELTTLVIKVMREQNEGRIIQNSSILGFIALKFRGAYNASKFAIEGLSDTLRLELRDTNIKVCSIQPGPIRSNFRINSKIKFLKNIDIENSIYKEKYQIHLNRSQKDDDIFTLGEEAVYEVLIKALTAKNPKAKYRVTFPTTLFSFLKRILPTKLLDYILNKI